MGIQNQDSKENIDENKTRLVAEEFIQQESDDIETFSLVSSNDSFKIIMAFVSHI